MKLHIDLQEGWTGDLVEVVAGARPAYTGRPSTRLQIGYADRVDVDLPDDGPPSVTVLVSLPERGITGSHELSVAPEAWVGVTLTPDGVTFQDQLTQFGYV